MGSMAAMASSMMPRIAHWLANDTDGKSVVVSGLVENLTGTSNPEAAEAVLQRNPGLAAQLHAGLQQLDAEWEAVARANTLAEIKSALATAVAGLSQASRASDQPAMSGWIPAVISTIVLASFGVVVVIVLTKGVSAGNETAATMLLGTLAAMATSVVSYWVGSSAGSARKDERLSQIAK